jgi:TPR repeat protein
MGMWAQSAAAAAPPESPSEQTLSEEKHFAECLNCVYSPAWWLSFNESLYFQPRNEAQVKQLEAMRAARSRYLALTNQATRHDLAAKLIAESGVGENWRRKLLLPVSATNQNLTPTLDRLARVIPKYKLLQSLGGGDALIQDDASTYFVMNFGRGADDAACTNALLIKEGVKAYSAGGAFKMVEAFSNVALSKEETAVLNRVAAAFQKEAAALGQEIANLKLKPEFEDYQARANDSSPYMEFLLAKAYLEGKGTDKNEQLGLEWMNRAAKNGSGDAQSYLDALGRKAH